MIRSLPVLAIFSTALDISQGERNCPFFRFTTRPDLPVAISKSVCRDRNAGTCSTSQTSAARGTCERSCTSVRMGNPKLSLIRSEERRVGKECRAGGARDHLKEKMKD